MKVLPYVLAVLTATPGLLPAAAKLVQEQDVLRVETNLVQVDVVVRGRDGAVDDISREDFTLFDDGIRQEIAFFEVDSPTAKPWTESFPERSISNQPDWNGGSDLGVTVLLIDQLNAVSSAQIQARARVLEFLDSLEGRQDRVAVYALDRERLRVLHEYAAVGETMRQTVEELTPRQSLELSLARSDGITGRFGAAANEVGLDQQLNDAGNPIAMGRRLDRQVAMHYLNRRVGRTAEALEAIANSLAGLPGRKNLVWLSSNFPFSFEAYSYFAPTTEVRLRTMAQLEHAGRALIRANVAVYPVDVRGLTPELFPPGTETMVAIAKMTGGHPSVNTNAIVEALQNAVDDTEYTYVLGFYPLDGAADGDFHRIRIETARDGLDLRYQEGYYGFDQPEFTIDERHETLRGLLTHNPLTATGVGLIALTEAVPGEPGTYTTTVRINLDDVELKLEDGYWVGEVDVGFIALGDEDTDAEAHYNAAQIHLTDGELQDGRQTGLVILRHVHDRSSGWLRVVARDPRNDTAGSLWVAISEPSR